MRIDFNSGHNSLQFGRKPNVKEMQRYTKAVTTGLKVLNKNVGLIVHNSTVPSAPKNNLGIGSLLSKAAQLSFIPFLAMNGFSGIQQEPDNHRSGHTASPYSPQAISKNTFMIPVERLATEEYGNLVDAIDIQYVVDKNSKRKKPNVVDYSQTASNYEYVLSTAYNNLVNEQDELMQIGLEKENRLIHKKLLNEFEEYKNVNAEELEPMALFEVISIKNNNEDWRTWNDVERNLYSPANEKALNHYRKVHDKKIDYYMFKQWLAEREISNANARNRELGISVIGDSPIAFTPVEEWLNQDIFMDGWALGCPPDYYSKDGQRWGFSILRPESIFNPDGTLGKGGELLKNRYEKMFQSSPGGVRIDHIIGLIDPHVYKTAAPDMNGNNSGRLYSSPNHPELGKYAKKTEKEYAQIIEKIVIPAAEKYGLTKENIICEDLGELTDPVRNIMKNMGLSGIAVTQFDYRGKATPARNVIMPGSHDNESYLEYTDRVFENGKHLDEKAGKLAYDTAVPNENVEQYKNEIKSDKRKFVSASFAELFTSPAKKIQLFFTTFLGMNETYNKPGSVDGCWTLRIPENFENLYWKNVKEGKALNFPEAIARAIRNRGESAINRNKDLLATLDEFTEILKK